MKAGDSYTWYHDFSTQVYLFLHMTPIHLPSYPLENNPQLQDKLEVTFPTPFILYT